MQKIRSFFQTREFIEFVLLAAACGLAYLIFVPKFGYFNDDWYLMYAAGAKGPSVFWDIFAVDRPLRALVMVPAYMLFGANPLFYNLSAFLFRLAGGLSFLWILRMLWTGHRRTTLWMSMLFVLYPGFLSQPNAIDYLCHLAGLAAGMLSIGLTLQAIQTSEWQPKVMFYSSSILLGWFYLGQMEWYIGLEFFRLACVFLPVIRSHGTLWDKTVRFFWDILPASLIPIAFLVWRLFYFTSTRGATDVDLQLRALRGEPLKFLLNFSRAFLDDFLDVIMRAWWLPLHRVSAGMNVSEWLLGFVVGFSVLLLYGMTARILQRPGEVESDPATAWKREMIWMGLGTLAFGLLPVILVGRSVDFKYFSRYTLIASVGAALLWPVVLSYVSNLRLRNILWGILILIASLTHYANGLMKMHETQATRNFWHQVSWRIPQMKIGTTLVAHYSVVAEEDYFTWGPANLIYYPESNHEDYVQPAIYALLLNEHTVRKVLEGEPMEFSNRRGIRTYPNSNNILVITQPSPASCMQLIDLNQVEISSFEDPRVVEIAPYSEANHVTLDESFKTVPLVPFGVEPAHEWCYYYEKAAYARQLQNWAEVNRLGDEAHSLGFFARDQIEWMPFLQAYAYAGNISRLDEIASFMASDPAAMKQACQILKSMSLPSDAQGKIDQLFCSK